MALIWCDGFDHYAGFTDVRTGGWVIADNFNLSDLNPRTGPFSIRINQQFFGSLFQQIDLDSSTCGLGGALYLTDYPEESTQDINGYVLLAGFSNDTSHLINTWPVGGTKAITIGVDHLGAVRVIRQIDNDPTTLAVSSPGVVPLDVYFNYECRVNFGDNGAAEVRINGVTVLNVSGLDLDPDWDDGLPGMAGFGIFYFGSTTNPLDFDDVYFWDETGSRNADFLGDCRIITGYQSADTSVDEWTVTGAAGHQALLTSDGDTSYIEGDDGEVSEFAFPEFDMDPRTTILAASTISMMRKTDGANDSEVQLALMSSLPGSPALEVAASGETHALTTSYRHYQDVMELDPANGLPWSLETLQAARLRLTKSTQVTPTVARVTQVAMLAVTLYVPPCLTRWAQCWRIERRDGEVFRFTAHDRPLDVLGETYQPCHSLAASAAELGTVLGAPGDVELAGIIADDAISEADLYSGLFDRARVQVWLASWDAPSEIPRLLTQGVAGNLSQGDQGFSMEVLTYGGLLQQRPLLQMFTPGCRWELGDARCGVDLDALEETGSATSVAVAHAASRAQHRVFWDSSRGEADGYFDLGVLEWTSGANAGQRSEIKTFAGVQFVLWRPTIEPIAVGDQYTATPGCDKTPDTCKTKYSNFDNYGGFPDVPGRDSIMQTPDSK